MSELSPTDPLVVDPLIGRVVGDQYRIQRPLAAGGMGRVYLAEQLRLGRMVAVKVLGSPLAEPGRSVTGGDIVRFRERFFREALLCSRLTHPNTVRIFDYGQTEDDVYFIVMEYLEGSPLSELLRGGGRLDPLRAISIALQVCASLSEAHGHGLIHRDLKPDNLILTRHTSPVADGGLEFVKVVDFGIAKDLRSQDTTTRAGVVYGSPAYMSPEQVVNQNLSPRSDIYGLGALLYRMLTGTTPFSHADPVAALAQQVVMPVRGFTEVDPELELPRTLEWVTLQCLAREPGHRFATTAELARALKLCELELRGLLPPLDPLPLLSEGQLVLPLPLEEELLRLGMGGNPLSASVSGRMFRPVDPSRPYPLPASAALGGLPPGTPPGSFGSGPYVSVPVAAQRTSADRLLLLMGGMMLLLMAVFVAATCAVAVTIVWSGQRTQPVEVMAPVAPLERNVAQPPVQPPQAQPEPPAPSVSAPVPAPVAVPAPASAPVPRTNPPEPRLQPSTPRPPVEPQPRPEPAPEGPSKRPRVDDLRNPYEDR